jgi:hypothetical protein
MAGQIPVNALLVLKVSCVPKLINSLYLVHLASTLQQVLIDAQLARLATCVLLLTSLIEPLVMSVKVRAQL